jgi:hypothetical protein
MRRAIIPALLLVLVSVVLGATVFRGQVAQAAQSISATIVGPLDAQGNVKVHEQGTAAVHEQGTVGIRSANDEVSIVGSNFGNGCDQFTFYTVPAGKTLVLEYIGAVVNGIDATRAFGRILFNVANGIEQLPFVFQSQIPNWLTASEAVHVAVPAGTALAFDGTLRDSSGGFLANCGFNISLGGYLQPNS